MLNLPVMNEVIEALKDIQSNSAVTSAVVISGKPGCFIAGADISMIERFTEYNIIILINIVNQQKLISCG